MMMMWFFVGMFSKKLLEKDLGKEVNKKASRLYKYSFKKILKFLKKHKRGRANLKQGKFEFNHSFFLIMNELRFEQNDTLDFIKQFKDCLNGTSYKKFEYVTVPKFYEFRSEYAERNSYDNMLDKIIDDIRYGYLPKIKLKKTRNKVNKKLHFLDYLKKECEFGPIFNKLPAGQAPYEKQGQRIIYHNLRNINNKMEHVKQIIKQYKRKN